MNKQQLIDNFDLAKSLESGIAIMVTVPGQEGLETIFSPHMNLDYKLDYYLNAYEEKDGELVLIRNNEIKIKGVYCTDKNLSNISYPECDDLTYDEEFLGRKVKDSLTDLKGHVTSVSYELDGRVNAYVEWLYQGEFKGRWFDIDRLDIIKDN